MYQKRQNDKQPSLFYILKSKIAQDKGLRAWRGCYLECTRQKNLFDVVSRGDLNEVSRQVPGFLGEGHFMKSY